MRHANARGIAHATTPIAIALAIWAGGAAGGPPPDSSGSLPSSSPTPKSSTASWGGIADAGGGFRVTPTRVVFEDRIRSAELTLYVNTGTAPATYRISLVRMRMSEDGSIAEVGDALAGESFADSLVRFSPRQVELEPGAAQTVRMQLRKPADLPPGEYRSHLVFRALPPIEDGGRDRPRGARGASIELRPVFGAAVPVIVRHGETAATVQIRALELRRRPEKEGGPALALEMRRTGNRSVYGDLTVTYTAPGGPTRTIGGMRGVAVYSPNQVRRVLVPLRPDPGNPSDPTGALWPSGTIRVIYHEAVDEQELLAEAELALP